MIIGVKEQQQRILQHVSYWNNSTKYPGEVKEGSGFKVGDIVEGQVDRACGHVKYFVNGKL